MKKNKYRISTLILIIIIFCNLMGNIAFAKETKFTPFKNHVIPGTINITDFDKGGVGVACSETHGSLQSNYRYRDDVQLNYYPNPEYGILMGWHPGDWQKYTVNISKNGFYDIYAIYATPQTLNIELSIGNEVISFKCDPTGTYGNYQRVNSGKMKLEKGTDILTAKLKAGSANFVGFEFVYVSSEVSDKNKTGPYKLNSVPSVIQAEDFDLTGNMDLGSDKGVYRPYEGIKITKSMDDYYVKLDEKQNLKYTFNCDRSDYYDFYMNGQGKFRLSFDGFDNSVFSASDGSNRILTVWLDKGMHYMNIEAVEDLSFDWIRTAFSANPGVTTDNITQLNENNKIYKDFYVSDNGDDKNNGEESSSFRTIEKARDEVRKISDDMDGDIVVHIMPGNYMIDEKLKFTEKDSGKNGYNIIYKGEKQFDKPVVNGGTKISDWEKYNDYIWKAPADIEDTRVLYVNDIPCQRARSKYKYFTNEYYEKEDSGYEFDGVRLKSFNFPKNIKNKGELELVWNVEWQEHRTPVEDIIINDEYVDIALDQPYYDTMVQKNRKRGPSIEKSFYIENAFEFLDEPGEFYFDKAEKTIYYYPFEKENLNEAETYVATTEFMMDISGKDSNNKVHNIVFDNISFKYGAWNSLNKTGVSIGQADCAMKFDATNKNADEMVPSQISVNNAHDIKILNSDFKCLGSAGVGFINGVNNCEFTGNRLSDIGGSGIIVGHWEHTDNMKEGFERCNDITISNNVIRRVGVELKSSCAISMYYVKSVSVIHNDIKDVPYTGISLGWGWQAEVVKGSGNNKILYNRIENVMNPSHDGGHIYTLGKLFDTIIKGNYCIKSGDKRGGIYLDEGTSNVVVSDNVVKNCENWLYARPNAGIREIEVKNNYSDTDMLNYDKNNVSLSGTVVAQDGIWPAEAQKIMDNAGVEDRYDRLVNSDNIPSWRTDFRRSGPYRVFNTSLTNSIEAENFMPGGEGVGYHKVGGDMVTIFYDSVIGESVDSDWLKYKIYPEEDGYYRFGVYASNGFALTLPQPKTSLYIDGKKVVSDVDIPNLGSWSDYTWTDLGEHYMTKGEHIIKIEFVDNGYSFDKWVFMNGENDEIYNRLNEDGNSLDYDEGKIVMESELPQNNIMKQKKISFDDMNGHWAETVVNELASKGIINGTGNNMYSPDIQITLYDFIMLIMRCMGIDTDNTEWKNTAVEIGLLHYQDEENSPLQRQRAAEIAVKAYEHFNVKSPFIWDETLYKDFDEIDPGFITYVFAANSYRFMVGDEENCFLPEKILTRAEAAMIINNFCDLISI